jgi:hypothetical protein
MAAADVTEEAPKKNDGFDDNSVSVSVAVKPVMANRYVAVADASGAEEYTVVFTEVEKPATVRVDEVVDQNSRSRSRTSTQIPKGTLFLQYRVNAAKRALATVVLCIGLVYLYIFHF